MATNWLVKIDKIDRLIFIRRLSEMDCNIAILILKSSSAMIWLYCV